MAEKIIAAGVYAFKNNALPKESLYFLDPDGHKLEIHTRNWKRRIAVKKRKPRRMEKCEVIYIVSINFN